MSYLGPEFEHDLFVSYSHGAFAGGHDSDLKAWSQKFAEDLRSELLVADELDGLTMFLDESERANESVDRTAQLTDHLQQRVVGSALFTLLMTPQYLRSKWCRQEFEWWREKHHPDTLGAGGRAYVCHVLPSDEAAWPKPIKDVVGYLCYDRDKAPAKARPFTYRGSTDDLTEYNRVLIDLTGDLMQRLRAIRPILQERERQRQEALRLEAEAGQVIYLHGREADARVWERAGDALTGKRFVVVPTAPDPVERDPKVAQEIEDRRVETLCGCEALLLLGTEDHRALVADMVVVGRQDRQLARARSNRLLPCAVLNSVSDGAAITKVKSLARALGIHWIDMTRNIWTSEIRRWLLEAGMAVERA